MNKFGVVLGVAAVATLAGCKDPDYKNSNTTASQNDVKVVDATPEVKPIVAKCQCAPGTKHAAPCNCGDANCSCIVETKPIAEPMVAEPVTTTYIVQNGDYLAKISKKFNVTISSIKRLNPSIKKDKIFVGQKIKLPGKIDVGEQKSPVAKVASKPAKKSAAKGFVPYTGDTKEYVVKNGDTLGAVAYGNGLNIRQLKELNGLKSDSLKIGQKLKIPAEKVAKSAPAANVAPVAKTKDELPAVAPASPAAPVETATAPAAAPVAAPETAEPVVAAEPAPAATESAPVDSAVPAAPATVDYVVKEGEDVAGIAISLGVQTAEIRELNNLGENDTVAPGQVIKVPAEVAQ